jgi:hypothetical protein
MATGRRGAKPKLVLADAVNNDRLNLQCAALAFRC